MHQEQRDECKKIGLTIKQLSKELGCTERNLNRYFKGEFSNPFIIRTYEECIEHSIARHIKVSHIVKQIITKEVNNVKFLNLDKIIANPSNFVLSGSVKGQK